MHLIGVFCVLCIYNNSNHCGSNFAQFLSNIDQILIFPERVLHRIPFTRRSNKAHKWAKWIIFRGSGTSLKSPDYVHHYLFFPFIDFYILHFFSCISEKWINSKKVVCVILSKIWFILNCYVSLCFNKHRKRHSRYKSKWSENRAHPKIPSIMDKIALWRYDDIHIETTNRDFFSQKSVLKTRLCCQNTSVGWWMCWFFPFLLLFMPSFNNHSHFSKR